MVPQIDDFLSFLNVFLCYRGNTAYTTELHGLSGQLCLYRSVISVGGGQRRGAAIHHLQEGPLSFWNPEGGQKNEVKNWPFVRGPLGLLLAPSVDILVEKVFKKDAKWRSKRGSGMELNPGPQQNQEKVSSTHHLQCFSHVERSKKDYFLCQFWGPIFM